MTWCRGSIWRMNNTPAVPHGAAVFMCDNSLSFRPFCDIINRIHRTKEHAYELTAGSTKKVWWKCKKNHSWSASIGARMRGNSCPVCSGHKVQVGANDLATTNPKLAKGFVWIISG
jgi:hypothetical protein